MVEDRLYDTLAVMVFTVSVFAMLYSLIHARTQPVFLALAGVCFAASLSGLEDVVMATTDSIRAEVIATTLWLPGTVCAVPVFWFYVRLLTAEDWGWPAPLWPHLVLPAPSLLGAFLLFSLPIDDQAAMLAASAPPPGPHLFWLAVSLELLVLLLPLQWAVYTVLLAIRLIRYRQRLRDLFASTEARELRWIWAVIGLFGLFWAASTASLALPLATPWDGPGATAEKAIELALLGTIAIWGLRQRPGLSDPVDTPRPATRYARSALTPDMSKRIAAKLDRAMSEDALHLNPNLSLYVLARHIAVSDNYISQVLSEEMGTNFYDFVNGHRIEAAKTQLSETDETILAIAYEVGFNSRSSFYTAFRKQTGQTPSAFRTASA